MDNSKKLQFGFLGAVALLLGMTIFASCANESTASETAVEAVSSAVDAVSPTTANAVKTDAVATAPVGPTTNVKFSETEFDYGTIDQGEKVTHIYKFSNTGSEPLIISNAKGSCGCTVPQWPKDPILPGQDGEIKVQFDSKGKRGKQSKRVTITANTDPAQTFLTIKGEVNAPEAEVKPAGK